MAIEPITFTELVSDPRFPELTTAYWQECGFADLPFNPHVPSYLAMEASGAMHFLAVRHEGRLVGYATVITTLNPHYSVKLAVCESLYVHPDYRHHGHGVKLLAAVTRLAKEQACKKLMLSAPSNGQLSKVLSANRHYAKTNEIFSRTL